MLWTMDEVSFSSRHNSIAKSLIFVPGLQYPFVAIIVLYISI